MSEQWADEDTDMQVLEDYEWVEVERDAEMGEEDLAAFWELPWPKVQLIFGASEMCMTESGYYLCWLKPTPATYADPPVTAEDGTWFFETQNSETSTGKPKRAGRQN